MGGIPRGSTRGHSHSRPLYGGSNTELFQKCSVFPFWYSPADTKNGEPSNPL